MPMGPQIVPPLGSHVLHRPWVGLQSVIVVFPDHTHLLFIKKGKPGSSQGHYMFYIGLYS